MTMNRSPVACPTTTVLVRSADPFPISSGRILAVDPGETSGWAMASFYVYKRAKGISYVDVEAKLSEVVWGEHEALTVGSTRLIWQELSQVHAIAYERFSLYPHKAMQQIGSTFMPVEVIGALRLVGALHGIPVSNYPASMTKSITQEALRGVFDLPDTFKCPSPHTLDAMRVLYLYLTKNFEYDLKRGFKRD